MKRRVAIVLYGDVDTHDFPGVDDDDIAFLVTQYAEHNMMDFELLEVRKIKVEVK